MLADKQGTAVEMSALGSAGSELEQSCWEGLVLLLLSKRILDVRAAFILTS